LSNLLSAGWYRGSGTRFTPHTKQLQEADSKWILNSKYNREKNTLFALVGIKTISLMKPGGS